MDAIIFIRGSLAVLMLLRTLSLRLPRLGSGRYVSLDLSLKTAKAASRNLRLGAGLTWSVLLHGWLSSSKLGSMFLVCDCSGARDVMEFPIRAFWLVLEGILVSNLLAVS